MNSTNSLNQQQQLKQQFALSQRQHNSLELLYRPVMELQTKIHEELSLNPVLELEEPSPVKEEELPEEYEDFSAGDAEFSGVELPRRQETISSPEGNPPPAENTFDANREDFEEHLDRVLDTPEEAYIPEDLSSRDKNSAFLFDSLVQGSSPEQRLLEQLSFSGASEKVKCCAEYIIGSLYPNGFFMAPSPEESNGPGGTLPDAAQCAGATLEEAQEALTLVQSFDPPGIAARDLKECLLLQVRRQAPPDPRLEELICNHLEDLYKNRLPRIAEQMALSMEELHLLMGKLGKLSLHPLQDESSVPYVVPEITIVREGDSFKILENDPPYGRVTLSKTYLAMLEDPSLDTEARNWIRQKVDSGKDLIRQLADRKRTIYRLAELILENQYEFMCRGPKALKPMTMIQAGDKLGLDNSTISKTAAGKYMMTPVGLYEFRYFFSGGYQSADGELCSEKAIKSMIGDLIRKEDKRKPLSDSKLSALLHEKGFDVARRTVAKYREELRIGSSTMRKVF